MRNLARTVYKKIEDAKNGLQNALDILELINKDDREPEVDKLINNACDSIYEAIEFLEKTDTHKYAVDHFDEKIRVMVHRKKKAPTVG